MTFAYCVTQVSGFDKIPDINNFKKERLILASAHGQAGSTAFRPVVRQNTMTGKV